jgi:aminoglycoside phosphotransferase (APT) family kinase protein
MQSVRSKRMSNPRSAALVETVRRSPGRTRVRTLDALGASLIRYLMRKFATPGLEFRVGLTPVEDGWESFIFHFELQAPRPLPAPLRGPLTLRLLSSRQGIPRGRRQFAVQRCLRQLGYPVPAPIGWEESCAILGGPFLIMEQIPGTTLLHHLLYGPWNVLQVAQQMADMQLRLHRLPTETFPNSRRPLLERSVAEMASLIHRLRLSALAPGIDWLRTHRPQEPAVPVIVHLDFHPLNLIQRDGRDLVVIDWDTADLGDPHADIATTLLLLRHAPNEGKNLWERLLIDTGRSILATVYLAICRRHMSIDDAKLAYYEAWAVLQRLVRYGKLLRAGPQAIGAKPSLCKHLSRDHVETLARRFQRLTGVALRLKNNSWNSQAK